MRPFASNFRFQSEKEPKDAVDGTNWDDQKHVSEGNNRPKKRTKANKGGDGEIPTSAKKPYFEKCRVGKDSPEKNDQRSVGQKKEEGGNHCLCLVGGWA